MASIGFGLVAALCWGVADFLAKQWGEQHGILNAVLFQHLFTVLILLPFVQFWSEGFPRLDGIAFLALAFGILSSLSYLLLYGSLVLGDLSINSPIASSSAALTVLLALFVVGERPTPVVVAGMTIVVLGVVLVNIRPNNSGAVTLGITVSTLMALGAALLLGLLNFLVPVVLGSLGAIGAVLLVRLSGTFLLAAVKGVFKGPFPSLTWSIWGTLSILASLDAAGFLAYFASTTADYISIGAALSGTFAAISAVLGWAILRERSTGLQHASVALIVFGIFAMLLP